MEQIVICGKQSATFALSSRPHNGTDSAKCGADCGRAANLPITTCALRPIRHYSGASA
jgi:hypothetical protein